MLGKEIFSIGWEFEFLGSDRFDNRFARGAPAVLLDDVVGFSFRYFEELCNPLNNGMFAAPPTGTGGSINRNSKMIIS